MIAKGDETVIDHRREPQETTKQASSAAAAAESCSQIGM
jgi:hypothetical protein